jgi:hypothetical protein
MIFLKENNIRKMFHFWSVFENLIPLSCYDNALCFCQVERMGGWESSGGGGHAVIQYKRNRRGERKDASFLCVVFRMLSPVSAHDYKTRSAAVLSRISAARVMQAEGDQSSNSERSDL